MGRKLVLTFWGLLLLPSFALAQAERFELGQRLKDFERTWDKVTDVEARKRALPSLQQAVNSFFSFRLGTAGQLLDQARHALLSKEEPEEEVRWGESIFIQPETRLFDASATELNLEIKTFYDVKKKLPEKAKVTFKIGAAKPIVYELRKLPEKKAIPLQDLPDPKSADLLLKAEIQMDDKTLATKELSVSRVEQLSSRLDSLKKKANSYPKIPASMEQATVKHLCDVLEVLTNKTTLETNYPAARLLAEAESVVEQIDKQTSFYGPSRTGEFWLGIPTNRSSTIVRLYVPEKINKDQLVPLVVALHGAGGSENLFFDGYGDGITRKECEKRNWFMVATQAGFGGPPPVETVIDTLIKRYPIDPKRVFVVGHSMGAAHAVAVVQQIPNKLAGVAALGGGGVIRKSDGLKSIPFFVGCGSADFALRGAKGLHESLKKAGIESTEFKEYPNIEHMTIVREAIPDVFAKWEKINK